ncbi:unnamed protein product [Acanthoscelides obtectus]|uniref:DDE Tnp4 domain-containing protein n=1 Tax=Acanthoscelides obtectus TaxID=200917 RepID=A0A9P0LGR2_ACAOB|nr:unnamed protein product [Acanthoscelides obtectus]CAK1682248.1 Protein ALP1-like [Acanthoscelides obtectus]
MVQSVELLYLSKMDVETVLTVILYRRWQKRRDRRRRYWVHPILSHRLTESQYIILYPKLRQFGPKFFNYFRMSIKSFDDLLALINDELVADKNAVRYSISPEEKLIITLRYLATGCSLGTLSYDYRIGKSTVATIIPHVCETIWRKLRPIVMSEPTKEKWYEISTIFEKNSKFPNCLGALDGKHIRLIQPEQSMHYNYKHFFSLVLLAIADANYCFVWVDIGAYGKNSDSGIFNNSSLYKKLTERSLDLPEPKALLIQNRPTVLPYVIVADEAFGMMENLMRPYGGRSLTYAKKIFNNRLTLARRYVECTFGIMCNKWRILHRPLDVNIGFAEKIVKAICTLHNYVRMRDGYNYEDTLYTPPLENVASHYTGRAVRQADNVRVHLTNYFINEGKVDCLDRNI